MKQVLLDRYGRPEEVARCAGVPDVGAPAAGEVMCAVAAAAYSMSFTLAMVFLPRCSAAC